MIGGRCFVLLLLGLSCCFGQLPVVHEFGADQSLLRPGNPVTLYWNVEGATEVWISGGVGMVSPTDAGQVDARLVVDAGAGFAPELVPQGAIWKFHDQGFALDAGWKLPGFDDSTWEQGPGELGFGEPTIVTQVDRLPDLQSAVYFRKTVELDYLDEDTPVTFRFKRDDGIVIWINGVELLRDNMPPGEINFETRPLRPVLNESEWVPFEIDRVGSIFQEGTNTIAVSIHQIHQQSSDLRFDFDLNYAGEVTPRYVYTLTATNESGSVQSEVPIEVELRGVPDADRDGLPDEWEYLNFGSLVTAGAEDQDGDGLTNFEEFDQSRLPQVEGTGLRLDSISLDGDLMRLEMPIFYQRNLGVEYSPDLNDGAWMQLGNFFEAQGRAVFVDPDSVRAGRAKGFYRAFLRPPSP